MYRSQATAAASASARHAATTSPGRPAARTADHIRPAPKSSARHAGIRTRKSGPLDRAVASATPPAAAPAHTHADGGPRSTRRSAAVQHIAAEISSPLGLSTEKLHTLAGVVATIAPASD